MLFYKLSRAVLLLFFKLYNRIEVLARERVPGEGGVIVAANHESYLDPPVLGAALRRRATFMAKEELFRIPVLGRVIKLWSLPVRRGSPRPSVIKDAVRVLREGGLVVIFPEGGRHSGGNTDLKRGMEMLARLSGATVVPAFIEGTGRVLPVGSVIVRPSKIRVFFGRPVKIEEASDMDTTSAVFEELEKLRTGVKKSP
jgi:1-acyl-sn-glycerol-3-phosphate acyltransferase